MCEERTNKFFSLTQASNSNLNFLLYTYITSSYFFYKKTNCNEKFIEVWGQVL